MSIIDVSKIGEWIKKNQGDIVIGVGFVLVALIAFGAGRLSAPEIVRNPVMIEESATTNAINLYGNVSQPIIGGAGESSVVSSGEKGLFVGSKNSDKYHWPWCAPAKNIKPENEVWFKSEAEAQAAGYSPSSCIQSQAPAGYKP